MADEGKITDGHLANLLRRIREELQANKPVLAYTMLQSLEKYLAEEEFEATIEREYNNFGTLVAVHKKEFKKRKK